VVLPTTMKACLVTAHEVLEMRSDVPLPKIQPDHILVRSTACALAPGDVRMLSGKTTLMQKPPNGFPYIPGSDTAGVVQEVSETEDYFAVGDKVVCRFDEPIPIGGLAQYRVVSTKLCEKYTKISDTDACGLSASAAAARNICHQYIQKDPKVLVIGGSGSVGSSVLQYAKLMGAKEVCAVSTQEELCKSLGADKVYDYRQSPYWWQDSKNHNDGRFDVVFDLATDGDWTVGARAAVKPDGLYVSLVPGVAYDLQIRSVFEMAPFVLSMVGKMLWSRLHPGLPKWVAPEALKLEPGDLKAVIEDVESGRIKPLVDSRCPLPFTEEGIKKAFEIQRSTHAHGKVVVIID